MTQSTTEEGIASTFLSGSGLTSPFRSITDPVNCPFIVRVRRSCDQAFLGTAFFVSPAIAIGCLHYLKDKNLRGQPTGNVQTGLTLDLGTHQIEGRLTFKDIERDFVAIRVNDAPTELTIPVARLAENIDATTLDNLCVPRNLFLKGYLGREGGVDRHQIEIRHKPLVQTEREHSERPFLRDAQFTGGWTEGLSGSPLLAHYRGEWIVLGMAYLGGEKSGNSRVLLADAILELLSRECPDAALLKPLPVQQLVDATRARKSRQRALYVVGGGLVVLALLGGAYSLQDAPPTTTPAETIAQLVPAAVSQTVAGVVRDSTSDLPLAGVTISLSDFPQTKITDKNGGFEFTVDAPKGDWVGYSAHKEGYEKFTHTFESGNTAHGIQLRRKE